MWNLEIFLERSIWEEFWTTENHEHAIYGKVWSICENKVSTQLFLAVSLTVEPWTLLESVLILYILNLFYIFFLKKKIPLPLLSHANLICFTAQEYV